MNGNTSKQCEKILKCSQQIKQCQFEENNDTNGIVGLQSYTWWMW